MNRAAFSVLSGSGIKTSGSFLRFSQGPVSDFGIHHTTSYFLHRETSFSNKGNESLRPVKQVFPRRETDASATLKPHFRNCKKKKDKLIEKSIQNMRNRHPKAWKKHSPAR